MICMKNLRFSSCLREKVRCQGPPGVLEHSPEIPGTKGKKSWCVGINVWSMGREDYNPGRVKIIVSFEC